MFFARSFNSKYSKCSSPSHLACISPSKCWSIFKFSSLYMKSERLLSASIFLMWSGNILKSLNFSRSFVSFSRQFSGQVIWLFIRWFNSFYLYEYSTLFSSMRRSRISMSHSRFSKSRLRASTSSVYRILTRLSSLLNTCRVASFCSTSQNLISV